MLYSFDDYTLDAGHYEPRQAGRLVPLEPRVLDVLACLVQHPGRTVTTAVASCMGMLDTFYRLAPLCSKPHRYPTSLAGQWSSHADAPPRWHPPAERRNDMRNR
jgi:hypothetical protein